VGGWPRWSRRVWVVGWSVDRSVPQDRCEEKLWFQIWQHTTKVFKIHPYYISSTLEIAAAFLPERQVCVSAPFGLPLRWLRVPCHGELHGWWLRRNCGWILRRHIRGRSYHAHRGWGLLYCMCASNPRLFTQALVLRSTITISNFWFWLNFRV